MEKLNEYVEAQKFLETLDWDNIPDSGEPLATICEALQDIQNYKGLEEQGLLLRVLCKVGDTLYYPSGYFNIVIPIRLNEIVMSFVGLDTYSFQYNCCSFDACGDVYEEYEFDLNDFGKTVFLTQEEAEQKLKEMNTDNGITE